MALKSLFKASPLLVTTSLCLIAGCAKKEARMVKLQTTMGDIILELDKEKAPVTSENFLTYVQENFYDGTIFHRVIPNFMIQGGGFAPDITEKKTNPPITNEASNGLKNDRGTIAMARTSNPHSATSQFFINLVDNDFLNYSPQNPGYTVFGKVIEGMDVVDKIAKVKTTTKGPHENVPVESVIIESAQIMSE
jgi:peptidyl-prolyl cis-trans isomerase B (cyclophilin B)